MTEDDDLNPALACEYLARWGLRPLPGGMTPPAETALTVLNLFNAMKELDALSGLRTVVMLPAGAEDIRFTVAVTHGQLFFLTPQQAGEALVILRHSPGPDVFLHLAAARGWRFVCAA